MRLRLHLTGYYKKFLLVLSGLILGTLAFAWLVSLSPWVVVGLVSLVFLIVWFLYGYERTPPRQWSTVLTIVVVACLAWTIFEFLTAFIFGLTEYHFNRDHWWDETVPIIACIVMGELLRGNLVRKSGHSKLALAMSTLLVTVLGTLMLATQASFSDSLKVAQWLFVSLASWVLSSVFLSFLCYKASATAAVVYRLLSELPVLLLPLFPDFNDFAFGVMNLCLPVVCFCVIQRMTQERTPPERVRRPSRVLVAVSSGFFSLATVVIIALFSGLFKYYPLSIASPSMVPHVNVGDFIIVEKLEESELRRLQVGDVLVFRKLDRIIVHRIHEILATSELPSFVTKGDANATPDEWTVTAGEVIGTTNVRIPFVGYPTLWLHNQLVGET